MKRNGFDLGKATRKAGRELTKGMALGQRVVPSKKEKKPTRMTTKQWLQGAL